MAQIEGVDGVPREEMLVPDEVGVAPGNCAAVPHVGVSQDETEDASSDPL